MRHVREEVDRINLEITRAAKRNDHEAMRKVLEEAQAAEASVKRVLQHGKELEATRKVLEEPQIADANVKRPSQHGKEPQKHGEGASSRTHSNTLFTASSVRGLLVDTNDETVGTEDKLKELRDTIEANQKDRKEARMASLLLLKTVEPFLLPAHENSRPIRKTLFGLYSTVEEKLERLHLHAAKVRRPAAEACEIGRTFGDQFSVSSTFLDSIVRQSQQAWVMPDSKEYIDAFAERKARIIKVEHEMKTMSLIFLSTLQNSLVNCGMLGASHDTEPYYLGRPHIHDLW